MAVPASKVKALCNDSETDLVRASRKPRIDKLTLAETKRAAARARKLFDKWQGQERDQARERGRQTGAVETDTNTDTKTLIFREALDNFEARLSKLESKGASATPAAKSKSKPKKVRAAEHRQSRAAIRKGMTATQDLVNTKRTKKKAVAKGKKAQSSVVAETKKSQAAKPAKKKTAAAKSVAKPEATQATAKPTKKSVKPAKKSTKGVKKSPVEASLVSTTPAKQRRAKVAAKQARVDRSGQSTRVLGHVSARGRRSQARRDAKNG